MPKPPASRQPDIPSKKDLITILDASARALDLDTARIVLQRYSRERRRKIENILAPHFQVCEEAFQVFHSTNEGEQTWHERARVARTLLAALKKFRAAAEQVAPQLLRSNRGRRPGMRMVPPRDINVEEATRRFAKVKAAVLQREGTRATGGRGRLRNTLAICGNILEGMRANPMENSRDFTLLEAANQQFTSYMEELERDAGAPRRSQKGREKA